LLVKEIPAIDHKNVAVGQNMQLVKIAVGQKCRRSKMPSVKMAIGQKFRRSKWPSVKIAVGQNGRRSKLRRSKDLEPFNVYCLIYSEFCFS
jgi:predicted NAD-dependent protein-ADP-ribosyltransferase YbiA (DUF1768 family)